eukprot:gene15124-biopygen13071
MLSPKAQRKVEAALPHGGDFEFGNNPHTIVRALTCESKRELRKESPHAVPFGFCCAHFGGTQKPPEGPSCNLRGHPVSPETPSPLPHGNTVEMPSGEHLPLQVPPPPKRCREYRVVGVKW